MTTGSKHCIVLLYLSPIDGFYSQRDPEIENVLQRSQTLPPAVDCTYDRHSESQLSYHHAGGSKTEAMFPKCNQARCLHFQLLAMLQFRWLYDHNFDISMLKFELAESHSAVGNYSKNETITGQSQ